MTIEEKIERALTRQPKYELVMRRLRDLVLQANVEETYKWQMPVYTVDGKNVLSINSFKNHFGIWFFQGALLNDPYNVLSNAQEGKTHAMRHWKCFSADDLDNKKMLEYIFEAVENQKQGRSIQPNRSKPKNIAIPEILELALTESKKLNAAYRKLTPGKQREYHEYISSAKRKETQSRRIEKIKPMILSGAGLNDQYK